MNFHLKHAKIFLQIAFELRLNLKKEGLHLAHLVANVLPHVTQCVNSVYVLLVDLDVMLLEEAVALLHECAKQFEYTTDCIGVGFSYNYYHI